ncbi:hypothetical protein [Actinomadura gamaensis]|uniref:Uncharacterized protein n=1 Tax=Actinomadura gamaensis TaxID=1763541 RepID=A0ABV9TZU2_9ACTN
MSGGRGGASGWEQLRERVRGRTLSLAGHLRRWAVQPKPAPSAAVPSQARGGDEARPDPSRARDFDGLRRELKLYRVCEDRPSLRQMAKNDAGRHGHNWYDIDRRRSLTRQFVAGFVRGCGGDEAEVARWTAAWERIAVQEERRRSD